MIQCRENLAVINEKYHQTKSIIRRNIILHPTSSNANRWYVKVYFAFVSEQIKSSLNHSLKRNTIIYTKERETGSTSLRRNFNVAISSIPISTSAQSTILSPLLSLQYCRSVANKICIRLLIVADNGRGLVKASGQRSETS